MEEVKSKFDIRLIYSLLALSVCSFLFSLFIMQLSFGLLTILWLFEKNIEKKKAINRLVLPIIIFGIVRIIAVVFSRYPAVSVEALYKEALFYLSFFSLSFYLNAIKKEKLYGLFDYFVIASVVVALIGIVRFTTGIVPRADSFSGGYSTFSAYLTAAFCILLFAGSKQKWITGILPSILLAVIFTGIMTSLGRINIFLACAAVVAALFLKKIPIKNTLVFAAAALIFAAISFTAAPSPEISGRIENPLNLSDRDVIFDGAKALMLQSPIIGFGPRTFTEIFPYYNRLGDKGVSNWHNDFLQIYFESGLIGIAAFLFLLIAIYKNGIRAYFKQKNMPGSNYILAILVAMACLILGGFITQVILSIIAVFFITALSSLAELPENKEIPDSEAGIKG